MRYFLFKLTLFFLSWITISGYSFSQTTTASSQVNNYNLEKGVAMQGYDPVSYFTAQKAIKGSSSNTVTHNGITYYFSSKENADLFKANPAKYEPQYGGWCAYAMGNDGSKVDIDPQTFKILDGKLYLFYNFHFVNTLKKWNANENTLKQNADRQWNKLVN